jgi:Acetyltransferase (GNAT) domain
MSAIIRPVESCTGQTEVRHRNSRITMMGSLVTELDWRNCDATLEYPFAGRQLGAVPFKARVSNTPWTSIAPLPDDAGAVAQLSQSSLAQVYSHPVAEHLPRIALTYGAIRYVARHYQRYTIETTGTFDAYLQRLSPKTRQTIKRKVRQYCAHVGSGAPWRRFETPTELREFHVLAHQISAETYQDRLFNAGLPPWPNFVDRIQKAGAARGFLLYHETVPTAFLFTPVHHGRAVYTSLGYDPRYARWSPGAVLQYFALASMFDDPDVTLMDFAEGEGQHKATLATGSTYCADIYYFRITPRSAAAVAAHILVRAVDCVASHALNRVGLRNTVRKMLRRASPKSAGVAAVIGKDICEVQA